MKALFLPTPNQPPHPSGPSLTDQVVGPLAPCPCCGCITIPNNGDAPAFICPICLWEIDCFISCEQEPSDQNHGLTLLEARKNYARFGAVCEHLRQYCRTPTELERPGDKGVKI